MKCERCGYDDMGTGSAHVCTPLQAGIASEGKMKDFQEFAQRYFKHARVEVEVIKLCNKYGAEAVIEAAISCERRKERERRAIYEKEIGKLRRGEQ